MRKIRIQKGLNLPAKGHVKTNHIHEESSKIQEIGLIGPDYIGMKPTMLVNEGDQVKTGQALFEDKKTPGVIFTSPATGTIESINRGHKRAFESILIQTQNDDHVSFESYQENLADSSDTQKIKNLLIESGAWPAFRTRPYDKTPAIDSEATSIFVTATDSDPLSVDPSIVINTYEDDFKLGLKVISKLSSKIFLCVSEAFSTDIQLENVETTIFSGLHPFGLSGTHIHKLSPAHTKNTVWHIGYQDVIAIGKLFSTGQIWTNRIVALVGPELKNPRLIATRLGANLNDIVKDETETSHELRVVSGSMLSGRRKTEVHRVLGKFHRQVTVMEEDTHRELLGWQGPGFDKFSVKSMFLSKFIPGKEFAFGSSTQGSPRAIVPVGAYEKVFPIDILPTPLLKALCMKDTATAEKLGALELGEEDLALCTFVCPGKKDYGVMLRTILDNIEKGL